MATSNLTFGLMQPHQEIVIRVSPGQGRYLWFIRPMSTGAPADYPSAGQPGGTNATSYTSAATLATAIQNALPTLVTSGAA